MENRIYTERDLAASKVEDVMSLLEEGVRQCPAVYDDEHALLKEENIYKELKELLDYLTEY